MIKYLKWGNFSKFRATLNFENFFYETKLINVLKIIAKTEIGADY